MVQIGIAHFLIRPPGLQDVFLESKSEGNMFSKLGIKNKDHQMLRTNNKLFQTNKVSEHFGFKQRDGHY